MTENFELKVSNLSFRYSNTSRNAFSNINFNILNGQIICIEGVSGSGKTTLAEVLMGMHTDYLKGYLEGSILFNNNDLTDKPIKERALKMGLLFQDAYSYCFTDNVLDEIVFNAVWQGIDRQIIEEKYRKVAELFNFMEIENKNPLELSHGSRKILLLSSLLVSDPSIYILDEVFSSLDERNIKAVTRIVLEKASEGHSFILLEHPGNNYLSYKERINIEHQGEGQHE